MEAGESRGHVTSVTKKLPVGQLDLVGFHPHELQSAQTVTGQKILNLAGPFHGSDQLIRPMLGEEEIVEDVIDTEETIAFQHDLLAIDLEKTLVSQLSEFAFPAAQHIHPVFWNQSDRHQPFRVSSAG